MQRRPKQRSSGNGNSASGSKPSKPSSSSLPRHHTISQQSRRLNQNSRKKKFNYVTFAIQLIIACVFGLSCMIFYRSATAGASSGSLGKDPTVDNTSSSWTGSKFGKPSNLAEVDNNNSETGVQGDVQQILNKHFEQQANGIAGEHPIVSTSKRTTEEANAYMNTQQSESVKGEQFLKQKLVNLYNLQQKSDVEDSSPIVTRYLGQKDLPHWLPKSSTPAEDLKQWTIKVDRAKEDMRKLDVKVFPELHGMKRDAVAANTSNSASKIVFPSPAKSGTHPIIQPTFGSHRSNVDAIFALAEGYQLNIYLLFIESLKATGFTGDLVLSVSSLDQLKPGVEEYLKAYQTQDGKKGINVVAYTIAWTCFEGDGITVATGAKEGVRKCALVNMYAIDPDGAAIKDPREPRPVATARFELYWAWSLNYDSHNWLMLIDSRDAFFQANPFADVERNTDGSQAEGLLYLFEENSDASTIGQSSFNSRWLKDAYGEEAVQPFFEKPIICSGSTMGETVAIEAYLRGAVAQFDKTKCKLKGCDQGFHNYLYYSGELDNVKGIRDVVVFPQGKGIINNLGVLRSKPLKEWGLLDENMNVLNWDKSISPVAHQFDRDDELNAHLKEIRKDMVDKFNSGNLADLNKGPISYPLPGGSGSHPTIMPTFGEHRSHVDAVMALSEGYELKIYILFIESLKETGFTGDLVLSVSSLDKLKPGVEEYLRSYHKLEGEDGINIVAYTVAWTCYNIDGAIATSAGEGVKKCKLNGMYGDENEHSIEDPYIPRPVATARYELYWAWSLHYAKHSWIMLIDSRDAYFQSNPFTNLVRESDSSKSDGLLYFFEENAEASNIGLSKFNRRWLKEAYTENNVKSFFDKTIICSGSTMGEQVAIESYLRGMVDQFTNTMCTSKGCDQGFHNYLYYSGGLDNVQGIREVVAFEQGKGIINNLGVLRTKPLKERGMLDESMKVLNWDKSISAVAHQWDRDGDLNNHLKVVRKDLMNKYYASKQ